MTRTPRKRSHGEKTAPVSRRQRRSSKGDARVVVGWSGLNRANFRSGFSYYSRSDDSDELG